MPNSRLEKAVTNLPTFINKVSAKILIKMNLMEGYQPIGEDTTGKRETQKRWEIIQKHIDPTASSCLDIGCNTGFFSHAIASHNVFTIGFDSELRNTIVANAQYQRPNLMFKNLELTPETTPLLPESDIIIFLSVFHHLVKYYEEAGAKKILKEIAQKCQKQIFFETGQFDETDTKFAHLLHFMPDVESFTKDFFVRECGFQECICLGEFETFLTPVKRKLFLLRR
ncbi:MAG: class I SAM-dependent methyltransferase [Candidatus Latescibacterota bacterium]